ncbi:hypothetical protein BS50DRAFT_679281 [Corynespora cassiicola Philippines]|uniref:Uncharacterized protein n=1 Tax=Corynespora cassiicola Philippines TaxID=1448308 RepID=A0A2T2NFW2_CORCC|nr:hypothetical protein BS50DRAFT_679281 [Corynespora cassiicola Philippines]
MLGFRPLQVAKRKYAKVPADDASLDPEKQSYSSSSSSDDDSEYPDSSPASSRASSAHTHIHHTHPPRRRSRSRSHHHRPTTAVSAYSYRNPRAFTRYFGLAIGSTLLLFVFFLTHASWSSIRSAELGLHRGPAPKPVWESFPFLKRYHGGIRTLVARRENVAEYPTKADIDPDGVEDVVVIEKEGGLKEKRDAGKDEKKGIPDSVPFDPYPKYKSLEYVDEYGPVEECFLDDAQKVRVPGLRAYPGVTKGMPDNVLGSYELLGLRNDVCFERFGRLGPYGMGYSRKLGGTGAGMEGDREGAESVWKDVTEVDFRNVRWGEVLERCLEKNKARFRPMGEAGRNHFFQTMAIKGPDAEKAEGKVEGGKSTETKKPESVELDGKTKRDVEVEAKTTTAEDKSAASVKEQPKAKHSKLLPRTVVLIRTWWDYQYDDEDILALRALISELSIASGGEYQVHFLIHVKDDNKQIWADEGVYQEVLKNSLPAEFEGMGTLWSERQMGLIYGGVEETMYRGLPVHGAYRSTFMPVTYFAHQHPEFDYYWHWEMDVRYTGHYYHLFNQVSKWAEQQPRKGLWERNARFYVPAVHGSWEDFRQMVRVQTEHGTNSKANTWSSHLPPNPHMPEPETQKPEKPIWGPLLPQDYPDIEIDDAVKPPTTLAEDNYAWGVGEPADLIVFNPLFDPDHTNWILNNDVTGYNTTQGLPPRRTAINTSGRLSRRLLETMHREQALHRHTMFSEMWPASAALHHGLKAVFAPHPVFIDRKWPVQYLAAIFNNGRNGASGGARLSVFSDERQHNFLGTTWYYHAGFAPNLWKRWLGYKVDNDGGEREEVEGEGRMCLPGVLLHPVKQVDLVIEGGEKVE